MKNKKTWLLIAALVVLIAGASVLYSTFGKDAAPDQLATTEDTKKDSDQQESADEKEEPTQVPDFTVYDIDGNKAKLSDFFGKPIILNFWASWCGPCQSEMPDFDKAYQELGDEIAFLMVNMTDGSRETVETASGFIQNQGYSFPVFYDTDQDAATTYGAYSLPTTYFIDEEGYGIARATGAIDEETLQKGIDMIYP